MALASSGDLSKVHVCLPDLMDSYSESKKEKPGKDAVLFHYGNVRHDSGNTLYCKSLNNYFINE